MSDLDKLNRRLVESGLHRLQPAESGSKEPVASKAPLTVGLVQVNNSFSGQNYLPYSIACLRSYISAHAPNPARYRFLPLVYKRMPVRDIVAQMRDADVVGFSTYVWNANISLEAARRLKEQRPE